MPAPTKAPTLAPTSAPASAACTLQIAAYGQCGGKGGSCLGAQCQDQQYPASCCLPNSAGQAFTCVKGNEYYYQCVPAPQAASESVRAATFAASEIGPQPRSRPLLPAVGRAAQQALQRLQAPTSQQQRKQLPFMRSSTLRRRRQLAQDAGQVAAQLGTQMMMQAIIEAAVAPPWFFSVDAGCEGLGATHAANQVGYISTVKGGEFLRALRRCVTPARDKAVYSLNSAACPSGYNLDAILGYVR